MTVTSTDDTPQTGAGAARISRCAAKRPVVLAAAFIAVLAWAAPARAQLVAPQGEPGITVEGTGEARSVPDVVEINLKLTARAELTDDAVVKHRDARKRAMETFKALKLDNLKIDERDLSLRPGNAQEMW